MCGDEVNPILQIVNYWEAQASSQLDRVRGGNVISFVPWQAVESDISHQLTKFLQAVCERQINLFLILTPELGVAYPYSGLPLDIAAQKDHAARLSDGSPVTVYLPPHCIQIPSLFSPVWDKRYTAFLSRMNSFFAETGRLSPKLMARVTVCLSGGYWKYLRNKECMGDASFFASQQYRQKTQHYFAGKEFVSHQKWKVKAYEARNRAWFHQQAEDQFRRKSYEGIKKKSAIKALEVDLFLPEAHFDATSMNLVRMLYGTYDFRKTIELYDEALLAVPRTVTKRPAHRVMHLSTVGNFRHFDEQQRQFLALKALLVAGTIAVDTDVWHKFSESFRTRLETLAAMLQRGELRPSVQAIYVTGHLWAQRHVLAQIVQQQLPATLRILAHVPFISYFQEASMVVIDPDLIVTQSDMLHIVASARTGVLIVLPRSAILTDDARQVLERSLESHEHLRLDQGCSYDLYVSGASRIVIAFTEDASSLLVFVRSMMSLADIMPLCQLQNQQLALFPMRYGQAVALFVLNSGAQTMEADMVFTQTVAVADLYNPKQPIETSRVTLPVPGYGVLSLALTGISITEQHERRLAQLAALDTQNAVDAIAESMLAGGSFYE